jgi:hypothetical protein
MSRPPHSRLLVGCESASVYVFLYILANS